MSNQNVKCPHCGSTAQVRMTYPPTVSDNQQVLTEGFVCGCGCHFSMEYMRDENGYWEIYFCCVDFVEKKGEKQ